MALKVSECESASEFDPSFLRQFNGLARRSAWNPTPNDTLAPYLRQRCALLAYQHPAIVSFPPRRQRLPWSSAGRGAGGFDLECDGQFAELFADGRHGVGGDPRLQHEAALGMGGGDFNGDAR
jgi:hypothetical protein